MSPTDVPLTSDPPAPADAGATSGPAEQSAPPGPAVPASDPSVPARDGVPDQLAASAVELAREAAQDVAEPGTVGEHLGVTLDEGGLTMHSFRCTARGYRGWRWAVTLAHVPGSDRVTVCDTVLLPGADSVLAPQWVPWSDRLAPGDLGAGDDLPYRPDDPLLVPGYTVTDEDDADQSLFWELGLGRERVIGREGLRAAADRWARGPHGPASEIAVQASAACATCAYLLPVSGYLRPHFGVCANEWSPADGTVVTVDFGCGAHSETDLELPAPEPLPAHILDETVVERVSLGRDEPVAADDALAADDEPADDDEPAPVEPVATDDGPAATDDEPAATDDEPAATDDEPAATDDEPAAADGAAEVADEVAAAGEPAAGHQSGAEGGSEADDVAADRPAEAVAEESGEASTSR